MSKLLIQGQPNYTSKSEDLRVTEYDYSIKVQKDSD